MYPHVCVKCKLSCTIGLGEINLAAQTKPNVLSRRGHQLKGLVTPIRPMDPSATGIKMKSRDQGINLSSDQGMLQRDDQAC